jgi:hypothetical protein
MKVLEGIKILEGAIQRELLAQIGSRLNEFQDILNA